MPYDAAQMKELQILEEAEKRMASPDECGEKLELRKDEKYIEVTVVTPAPLGRSRVWASGR